MFDKMPVKLVMFKWISLVASEMSKSIGWSENIKIKSDPKFWVRRKIILKKMASPNYLCTGVKVNSSSKMGTKVLKI